jgi:cellulose synthase/poly-beta-1,6-N-acetylglucosamine synthase-like glycosyltransferase
MAHFRTAVLRDLHGWDAWNVTEDADLGIRLALAGYRVADLASTTLEEAPATLPAWMHQRARWMKGFMQVCITHSRRPAATWRALGPSRFLAAVTMTFGTVAAALAFPLCTIVSIDTFLDEAAMRPASLADAFHSAIGVVLFAAGFFAMMAPAVVGVRRRGWWTLLPWVALLPLYYVFASVAAWRGLFELLRHPFRWNKTEHGLALTSRAGLVTGGAAAPPRPLGAGGRG